MANRLSNESSPYLLQHKDNPVDWYPWSSEALNMSRTGDKPIFLSIGYSACHWCHVMEHESFENERIAEYLNENFISIKVDREERPDLDQIYMQAVMAMQGHGGWPLSAFLTPDQDFFFGGTYWPPVSTAQMPGFDRVLASVLDAWHNRREQVVEQSRQITAMINQSSADPEASSDIDSSLLRNAARSSHNRFDSTWGGFGSAPKFPQPMDLSLLLNLYEHHVSEGDSDPESPSQNELLEMVEVTLKKMYQGGIYDHLGGGFARYSVDARWLVPHFEKMLYDNALLASVYLHAGQVTGDRFYLEVCEETLNYLSRYMMDSSGGIHSTEDADSEGEEGKFYVWSESEIKQILGPDVGTRFCQLYNVTPSGNFEGRNILHLTGSFDEFAESIDVDRQSFREEIRTAQIQLLDVRDKRIRPGLDDKILTSWNALAIQAFSEAAVVLENDKYADTAFRAAEFVWDHLRDDDGRLLHTWRNGVAKIGAFLDDYAYLINAFLSLYRIRFDDQWIARASDLATVMLEHFHDDRTGAFFFTSDDQKPLIARPCEFQDSAVPSGNSMAATALLRLGRIQGKQQLVDLAKRTMQASLPLLNRAPQAASQMLVAIESFLNGNQTSVLVTGADPEDNAQAIMALQKTVKLDETLVVVPPSGVTAESPCASLLSGKKGIDHQPTLYVCKQFKCEIPVVGLRNIETLLHPVR